MVLTHNSHPWIEGYRLACWVAVWRCCAAGHGIFSADRRSVVVMSTIVRGLTTSTPAASCRGRWPVLPWPTRWATEVSCCSLLIAVDLRRSCSSTPSWITPCCCHMRMVIWTRRRIVLSTQSLIPCCAAEDPLWALLVVISARQPTEVAGYATGCRLTITLQGREERIWEIRVHFFTHTSSHKYHHC